MTEEMTYYDLLDVDPQASEDQIKKAYYRKIRIFTNEEHPKEFMKLRNAYEVLSDSVKRRDYDNSLYTHPESLANMEEIEMYMNNDLYEEALHLIKMEMQNGFFTEDLLTKRIICETRLQNYWEALEQMKSLSTANKADKIFYYLYQTIIYRELSLFDEAEQAAKQLLRISPEIASHHVVYASIFYYQNRYSDVKTIYNDMVRDQELNVEFIPVLLDYVTLQEHIALTEQEKKRLRYAILSTPKDDRSRSSILYQMIDYIRSLEWVHFNSTKEICDLAEQMNTINDDYIQDEIRDIRQWIRDREIEAQQNAQPEPKYVPPSRTSQHQTVNAPPPQRQEGGTANPRGNILIAIIVGLLLSGPLTPVGGIIGGFIYYRFAQQIWNLIGCLVMIVIAIVVIALFFG